MQICALRFSNLLENTTKHSKSYYLDGRDHYRILPAPPAKSPTPILMHNRPSIIKSEYVVEIDPETKILVDPKQLLSEGTTLEHVRGSLFVLHHEGKTVSVVIESADRRNLTLTVKHRAFRVVVSDHRDQLLAQLGMDDPGVSSARELTSPMPGLVLEVCVRLGDCVSTGDPLLVLEAMKMENEIRSEADGIIAHIHVKSGESVQKNQLLIEFEQEMV